MAVLMVGTGRHVGRGRRRCYDAGIERVQRGDLHAGRGRTTSQDKRDRIPVGPIAIVTGRGIVPATTTDSVIQTLHGIVI